MPHLITTACYCLLAGTLFQRNTHWFFVRDDDSKAYTFTGVYAALSTQQDSTAGGDDGGGGVAKPQPSTVPAGLAPGADGVS